jgi:hypothetical protein
MDLTILADDQAHDLDFGVDLRLRHKNQKIMAAGPDLELPLARERQVSASVA